MTNEKQRDKLKALGWVQVNHGDYEWWRLRNRTEVFLYPSGARTVSGRISDAAEFAAVLNEEA